MATEKWLFVICMSCNICPIRATPIVSNIACNIDFPVSYLIFCNVTLLCVRFAYCALFLRHVPQRLLSRRRPFSWRRLDLGDAFSSWRRLDLGDTFSLGDASHYFKRRKIKAESQGTSFSQTGFTFYLGDLIKNPREGKERPLQLKCYIIAYISQLK